MFNLHVGIPGIASDILESIAQADGLKKNVAHRILSRQLWQERFRGLVNSKRKEATADILSWRAAKSALAELQSQGSVGISQHAMLGVPTDCFAKSKPLPKAESRISMISEIFSDVPLVIHLAIANPLHYHCKILGSLPAEKHPPIPDSFPNWSGLVRRIATAAPNREIYVWDFTRPERVALAFCICLLDTMNLPLIVELKKHLSIFVERTQNQTDQPRLPGVSTELINQVESQYLNDLVALRTMKGVTFMEDAGIRSELYV